MKFKYLTWIICKLDNKCSNGRAARAARFLVINLTNHAVDLCPHRILLDVLKPRSNVSHRHKIENWIGRVRTKKRAPRAARPLEQVLSSSAK